MDDRVLKLETELKELQQKINKDKDKDKDEKIKKEKKPRAQSEYNKFMSKQLKEIKEKKGEKYDHKEAFKEAANSWKKQKE